MKQNEQKQKHEWDLNPEEFDKLPVKEQRRRIQAAVDAMTLDELLDFSY